MRRPIALVLLATLSVISVVTLALNAVQLAVSLDAEDGGIEVILRNPRTGDQEAFPILTTDIWRVGAAIGIASSIVIILGAILYTAFYQKPKLARSRTTIPITFIFCTIVAIVAVAANFTIQARDGTQQIALQADTGSSSYEVLQERDARLDSYDSYTTETWVCQTSRLSVQFARNYNLGMKCQTIEAARWFLIPQAAMALIACGMLWYAPPQKIKKNSKQSETKLRPVVEGAGPFLAVAGT